MIRKLLSWLGAAVLVYVVLFVPVGRMTLWQHFRRIWATPEAQEMSSEVEDAVRQLGEDVQGRISGDAGMDAEAGIAAESETAAESESQPEAAE
ncbi:MAG: hypothetical protein AAF411_28530 [Myxococcota bacterium]